MLNTNKDLQSLNTLHHSVDRTHSPQNNSQIEELKFNKKWSSKKGNKKHLGLRDTHSRVFAPKNNNAYDADDSKAYYENEARNKLLEVDSYRSMDREYGLPLNNKQKLDTRNL